MQLVVLRAPLAASAVAAPLARQATTAGVAAARMAAWALVPSRCLGERRRMRLGALLPVDAPVSQAQRAGSDSPAHCQGLRLAFTRAQHSYPIDRACVNAAWSRVAPFLRDADRRVAGAA